MPPRVKITGEYSYQGDKGLSFGHIVKGVAGFLFVAVGTAAVTTQYMARTLNYTSALGEPLIHLKGIPFYQPFKAYNWLFQLTSGGVVSKFTLSCIGFLLAGLFFAVMILIFSLLARSKGTLSNVHGSARWAQKQDIIEAGLLPRPDEVPTEISVYTGGWVDPKMKRVLYLTHGGPEHILAFAPTRSGKGVGLVIPSLLRWAGSVLVYDIKGENYQLTSGWREKELGSVSIRLDPTDPDAFEQGTSGTFNPLEELQLDYGHKTPPPKGTWPAMEEIGSGETAAVQNLATMVVDPDGKGLEDHWGATRFNMKSVDTAA